MSDETLRRRAYAIIQNKLLDGELRAGDVLSEQALAAEIGISRTPVREAIWQLQSEGLFDKKPRAGTIVRLPGQRELSEIYDVREALESHAAAAAASQLTKGDLADLKQLHAELRAIGREFKARRLEYLDEPLLRRFFEADVGFHLIILQGAHNRRALQIINEFRVLQRVFEYGRLAHGPRLVEAAIAQHGEVLEALKNQDGQAAHTAMARHIAGSKEYAMQAFERRSRAENRSEATPRPMLPRDVERHLAKIKLKKR
jgi:DNA-binding GntR family transcriptional regulator